VADRNRANASEIRIILVVDGFIASSSQRKTKYGARELIQLPCSEQLNRLRFATAHKLGGWFNVDLVLDDQTRLCAFRQVDGLIPEILRNNCA